MDLQAVLFLGNLKGIEGFRDRNRGNAEFTDLGLETE